MESGKDVSLPPFALWLTGLLFVVEAVNLALPDFALPGAPASFAVGHLLDGVVFSLAAALLHRRMWSRLPLGMPDAVFLLLCLKLVGHGAHMAANSSDAALHHSLASAGARHVVWVHTVLAHWLTQGADALLFAAFVWRAAPRSAPAEDPGLEMPGHILAALHGLTFAVQAISTGTVPVLLPVWASVAWTVARRRRALSASIMRYAYLFCAASLLFVAFWGISHGGRFPTYAEINGLYKQ